MRRLCYLWVAMLCLLGACGEKKTEVEDLQPDKLYFFYSNGCPHCHSALEYINQKYPKLSLSMVNVANAGGYELLVKCARRFKLGRQIGTPLLCMGDNYLMGWTPEYEAKFDSYVKPYL